MERIDEQVDQERIEYWRQYNVDAAATEDQVLDPLDRRDREDVIAGTYLKRDDDILLAGSIPVRIVGPGSGRLVLIAMNEDWFGDEALGFEITPGDVTDRAPVDPEETPMPIAPQPEMKK